MTKLIIFDWDDVFTLGSKEAYFECYHKALIGVGVNLEPRVEYSRILEKWGQPYEEELRGLLIEKPELFNKACKLYEKYFFGDVFINKLSLAPNSVELLMKLSKKYKLAIATGSHPTVLINKIFPKFKIPKVFNQIITVHDLNDSSKGKPDPHMVQVILDREKLLPTEAVLVGDAKNDVLMAQAAGIEPIVVLSGHLSRSEAFALGVTKIIDNVAMLESVL